MTAKTQTQFLVAEIRRYLAAVDAFRAEDCEPHWLPERQTEEAERPKTRKTVLDAPIS
jgi:hypothetical protein